MKKEDLISIIIVNWNGKKWFRKCLDSLKNQTYKRIEIIVVDNGSMDDSVKFLKTKYPKVNLFLNKENLGYAKAINIGIKNSKGKYIIILNSDTWVKKDLVAKLLKFYLEHNFAAIGPIEKKYYKEETIEWLTTIDPTGGPARLSPDYDSDKLLYLGVCVFFSKNIYIETKGLDEDYFMYYEDLDWFWRLSLLGKKYTFVKDVFVYHAGAGSTGERAKYKMFLWRNQNALQTLLKNYSFITLVLILPLYFIQNIFEIGFFLLVKKPDIALTYILGWHFNIKNINKTLKKRKWVQSRRKISDLDIIKKMYIGFGKLQHFFIYLRHEYGE